MPMYQSKGLSSAAVVLTTLTLLIGFVGGFVWLISTVGVEGSLIWSTLIAAIGWMISEHISRRREHQKLLAEQKREMYFAFLDFMLSFMKSTRAGEARADATPEQLDELLRWSLRLVLVGSDEVVKAWNSFRSQAGKGETTSQFATVAKLLSEMRKDCGHYGTALSGFELLSLIIKGEDLEKLKDRLK